MRTYARLLVTLCGPVVVIVALLMLVTPASVGAPINAPPISDDELEAPAERLLEGRRVPLGSGGQAHLECGSSRLGTTWAE